jgi:hypothetical protein
LPDVLVLIKCLYITGKSTLLCPCQIRRKSLGASLFAKTHLKLKPMVITQLDNTQ